MSTPRIHSALRLCASLTFAAAAFVSSSAHADMLPMVVDHTRPGMTHFWWSSTTPNAEGPVSRALFADDARGTIRPTQLQNFAVSRVFQREDLSTVNAQQLARMSGATSFFLGEAVAETQVVGWLASSSATVTIAGQLYDVRSGAQIGEVTIVGRAVSSNPERAIELAAASASKDLLNFQPRGQQDADASAPFELIFRTPGAADAYVQLSTHIRQALEGRGEVGECRASEGEVVLCLRALPGQDPAQLRAQVIQTLRAPLPNIIMDELRDEEHRVIVHARVLKHEALPSDRPGLPR